MTCIFDIRASWSCGHHYRNMYKWSMVWNRALKHFLFHHAFISSNRSSRNKFELKLFLYKVVPSDGIVLAFRWVNSGPEMLPDEFEHDWGKIKANKWFFGQNSSLSYFLVFGGLAL